MTFDLRDPKALNKLTVQVNEVLKSRAVGLIEPLLYRLGIPTGTLVVRKTRKGYDNVDNLGSGMKNIIEYKTLEFELINPNKEKRSLPHTTKRSRSTCLVPQPGVDHRQLDRQTRSVFSPTTAPVLGEYRHHPSPGRDS
jgi:hypothetical protein